VLVSRLDRLLSAKDDIVRDVDEEPAPFFDGHVQSAHHAFGKALSFAGRMIVNPDLVPNRNLRGVNVRHSATLHP
jgi:hypothetical protein